LFAKKNKGRIILRLEDTDKYRNVPKSAEGLAKTFDDLGICFDESPSLGGIAGPYVQSQRLHLYQDYSQRLLKMGSAYKCFCSKERLKVLSAGSIHPGGYDGRCRMLTRAEVERKTSQGLPFTIRLKVKENGTTDVRDEVYGIVTFSNALLDDQILLRSDGFPTYHFANVVDDHLMNISHVIRGEEWLSSTPKHIQLYQAFGWTPPVFVHLPLLLRKEGKGKLSKRDSSMSVDAYLRKGYLPVSLLNFVGLLGWAPHTGQEIMTLPQMINAFSLADLNKASPRVDVDRLKWINKQHCDNLLSSSADSQPFISDLIACIVAEYGDRIRGEVKENLLQSKYVASVANLVKERTQLMPEMVREMEYFFVDPQMSLETGSGECLSYKVPQSFPSVAAILLKVGHDII
jgi:glutamyl-tRNA synthetase